MKKIIFSLLISTISIVFFSCNDKADDEIFTKNVYFANNGYQVYEINYTEDGNATVPISLAINGNTGNGKNVNVTVAVDPDTLAGYNLEKYRGETELYLPQLPEDCYTIQDMTTTIPSGSDIGLLPIDFHLDKIDKLQSYVLPLKISQTSEYEVGPHKYSRVLMRIVLRNSFSGTYSGSAQLYDEINGGDPLVISTKVFSVVDDNTCFFYAGNIDEENKNKEKFLIRMTVDDDKNITLEADNPELNLEVKGIPVIKEEWTVDPTNHAQRITTTTINMEYVYIDKWSNEYFERKLKFSGNLLMLRRETIIPNE